MQQQFKAHDKSTTLVDWSNLQHIDPEILAWLKILDWFDFHNMKHSVDWDGSNRQSLWFRDPQMALLFKLTWC